MRPSGWAFVGLTLMLAAVGCVELGVPSDAPTEGEGSVSEGLTESSPNIVLEEAVPGSNELTHVTSAGDGTGRLFVVERYGRVLVVEDGSLEEEPYLDLGDAVGVQGRGNGLLGLAFSPTFATDGRLYVSYTNETGDSVLSRFTLEDPRDGRPTDEEKLLQVQQPSNLHNGGHVVFGPDGYLYYGLGDGGPMPDAHDNGQNRSTLHGSLLRLDVSGEEVQAPPDNPFVDGEGHELVWAYGLRNPWRFSFDRETGDLFIGDVGAAIEEIDHQPADSDGGENYGWKVWAGEQHHAGEPSREGYTFPILSHNHSDGGTSALIGGFVYRGSAIPDLEGTYVYGDLNGTIWTARNTSEGWRSQLALETNLSITSFGQDSSGELYVSAFGGDVYRIAQAPRP